MSVRLAIHASSVTAGFLEDRFSGDVDRRIGGQEDPEGFLRPPHGEPRPFEQHLDGFELLGGANLVQLAAGAGFESRVRVVEVRLRVRAGELVHFDLALERDDAQIGLRGRDGDLPPRLFRTDARDADPVRGLDCLRPPGRREHRIGDEAADRRLRLRLRNLSVERTLCVVQRGGDGRARRGEPDRPRGLEQGFGLEDGLRRLRDLEVRRERAPDGFVEVHDRHDAGGDRWRRGCSRRLGAKRRGTTDERAGDQAPCHERATHVRLPLPDHRRPPRLRRRGALGRARVNG